MATKTIGLDQGVIERIERLKPDYLSLTAFCSLILDQHIKAQLANSQRNDYIHFQDNEILEQEESTGLDGWHQPSSHEKGLRETISTDKPKQKNYQFSIPDNLLWCQDELTKFWKEGKKKNKTENAANFLFMQLNKIKKAYGKETVLEQLELATAEGFQSITLNKYEQFKPNPATPKQEPEPKHPAYKVFKAPDPSEESTTNEILKDLI
tara:strand:+ start:305 stop:931 length:627 start_codon:yes stop_codon:yes gene_type:complete